MPDETPAAEVPAPDPGTPMLQDKRLWLTLATMLVVAANKKLGLNLGTEDLLALSGMAAAYITQSQWGRIQQAKTAGQVAASKVVTTADALKVITGSAKPLALLLCLGLALMPSRSWADEPGVPDAPVATPVAAVRSAVVVTDAGATVRVTGGCYLDSDTCIAQGKEVAALRAETAELKKGPGSSLLIVGTVVILALAGGFALGRATQK